MLSRSEQPPLPAPWQFALRRVSLALFSLGSKVLSSASEVVAALELRTRALEQAFIPSHRSV